LGGDTNKWLVNMEVDKVSFYPLLLDILTDISEAHFVAFDLELSGVPSKGAKSGQNQGRPSLQQRYLDTKEAAERYQILQIGLTCVTQDVENKKYIFKPYNFELSPLIDERGLDIERIFSFQSGAAEFLLRSGFNLSTPFESGVPYLSRTESKEAREKHAKRQDKSAIPDVQLKPTEVESLAFLERVRGDITAWMASKAMETLEYLNITAVNPEEVTEEEAPPPEELSRFEKRLVHQLVRAEFPELVGVSKRGFIQVIRFDKEREDQIAADRKRELHERIGRQKGFRWIIEALIGTDISNLDLRECAKDPVTGESIFADMDEFKAQFYRAHTLMRSNPRILIGHNCFLDLVYIYRTFIGELPNTVEQFQQELHELWPLIVDTKYMSTHNCGDINPVSSLEQIAGQLSIQMTPVLEVDREHMKYAAAEALHEAGYDSFLTAQIGVRLSAKLEKDGAYVDVNGTAESTTAEAEGITNGVNGLKLTEDALATHTYHEEHAASPSSEPDGFVPSVAGAKWKRRGDPTLPPPTADDPFEYNPRNLKHRHHDEQFGKKGFEGGMPGFGSDFWRVYGNKLRVFGTEEGMCLLNASANGAGGENGGVNIA
jgi:poly(A)-specific ribonuclease